jgi:hypothetical protein
VIVVATADFEVYHDVVGELRDRGVAFTTVEPDEPLPAETSVVVTAVIGSVGLTGAAVGTSPTGAATDAAGSGGRDGHPGRHRRRRRTVGSATVVPTRRRHGPTAIAPASASWSAAPRSSLRLF